MQCLDDKDATRFSPPVVGGGLEWQINFYVRTLDILGS